MSLLDALLLDPAPLDVWIAYRTDGIKGSGTLNDPYDGSTQPRFDGIMSSLPSGKALHVHLGPSPRDGGGNAIPFLTGGFWIASDGATFNSAWVSKQNTVISGAGMDVTVVKLVPGSTSGTHYFAVGASTTTPVDYFQLSDLTIDCNLPNDASVACGAVRVMGSHVRIRNVKCINWGNRTVAQDGFVIALLIGDPEEDSPSLTADDAGITDCIALNPSDNNTVADTVVNIFHIGGRELVSVELTQFGRSPFLRNCFIDCGSPTTPVAEYRGLSMGACHGGVVEGNQVHNTAIGGPFQGGLKTREIIVRNNTFRNVIKGPNWNLGKIETIGVEKLVVEGNQIELVAANVALPPSGLGPPIGIFLDDVKVETPPSAFIHGQVVIRNNKIRYVDGTPGSFNGYGIDVRYAGALMVTDNVVEVTPAYPLRNTHCGAVTYFNNRTPAGKLIRGYESNLKKQYGELETDVEDAFVLAYLERK